MYSTYESILNNEEDFNNFARASFDVLDKDDNEFIEAKEFELGVYTFLNEAGLEPPPREELRTLFKLSDENKDGKFSFEEYCNLLRNEDFQDSMKEMSKKWFERKCTSLFNELDAKKTGKLPIGVLNDANAQIAKQVGVTQASKERFDKSMKTLSKNPKFVTIEEFTKVIMLAYSEHFGEDPTAELKKAEAQDSYGARMAEQYTKYIEDTGLAIAFKVIFAEILSKNIAEDDVYAYTVTRLRQIGKDIAYIQSTKLKKKVYY